MIYRLADKDDLPGFFPWWSRPGFFPGQGHRPVAEGDPDGPGLLAAIGRKTVHVLDEEGQPSE